MRSPTHSRIVSAGLAMWAFALPAMAQVDIGLGYADGLGLPTADIRTLVASIIRALMGLLGLYLVLRVIWGGFLMMTHGGSEEKRAEAIATLKNAVIGLVIIMMSASIAKFVVDAVANASQNYLG